MGVKLPYPKTDTKFLYILFLALKYMACLKTFSCDDAVIISP